jgi:phytoene desaturase
LAAAIRLAAQGHDVELFEARDQLGGRGYVYRRNGFTFDGGPTVITAPFLFDELFALAGRRREDYVTFVPLDPFYRIFRHDGRWLDYNGDSDFIADQIRRFNPADVSGYERFIRSTRAIFEKGFVELADRPFLRFGDMLGVAPDLVRLQSYRTVYQYVSQFVQDDFLRRCFSFHPLLVGGNPFQTTSIYALIHYLERQWGVHYALGGTGALVEALGRLAVELGVGIHLNAAVDEILVGGRSVRGLRLADGSTVHGAAVVSNGDMANTYRRLIPAEHRRKFTDRRIERMRHSMSLFVLYFGTNRRYPDAPLMHHNILLGERYRGLLEDIFDRKVLAEDFSLYLHMPTRTDPSLAPEGHEAFYVLSPVPNLQADVDWAEVAPRYKARLLEHLEEHFLPDLRSSIVAEHFLDPRHFAGELRSYQGSAFSIEPILTQSAWFRPHNRSEEFDNLYLVGAGTHPGAGLPGVLSSAKITADLIGAGPSAPARRHALPTAGAPPLGLPPQLAEVPVDAYIRAHSKTFALATALLPAERRRAIRALYAFCRLTDDLVDQAGATHAEVEAWRRLIARPASEQTSPALAAWATVRRDYGVDRRYEQELIDGVALDLEKGRHDTWDDLERYCYLVASTVGLMSIPILGLRRRVTFEQARPYAVQLGIALQLTNILRDVGEDAARGRVYLPVEDLQRFDLTPQDILEGVRDERFRRLMRFEIARARDLFRRALPGTALLSAAARPAVGAAALLYRAILDEIELLDFAVHTRRAHTSTLRKLRLLPGILWHVFTQSPPSRAFGGEGA